tara:strand:- start:3941 stop:4717 length:777 start_codon:yes stop_codon:yes gene_type:complete
MLSKIKKIISKKKKSKIICLTSYSKNIAEEIDKYTDIVLVGDSLGSVLYNYKTTRKVTLQNIIDHSRSVRMGVKKSLMVVDMPYQTYRNKSEAIRNVRKVIKLTKCDAVKLEGGRKIKKVIEHLVKNKIQVLGHLGLLPQSVRGRFKFKGKTDFEKKQIFKDAQLLEKIGVFGIVLECVEKNLAKKISNSITIPTIGIGSSVHCDGQVLVTDDILGLNKTKIKFVKKFVDLKKVINIGVKKFRSEVISRKYPSAKHSY